MTTRERPILFNSAMVRAILAGRKTQTRRIVKLPPAPIHLGEWEAGTISADPAANSTGLAIPLQGCIWHTRTGKSLMCPHGQPGDRLWVRETWGYRGSCSSYPTDTHHAQVQYHADDLRGEIPFASAEALSRAAPAQVIKYPPGFSDLDEEEQRWVEGELLVAWWRCKEKIPAIHMPRWACRLVLEITDVRVERLQAISEADAEAEGADPITAKVPTHRDAFRYVWEDTGGDWDANPWVWVVGFRQVAA